MTRIKRHMPTYDEHIVGEYKGRSVTAWIEHHCDWGWEWHYRLDGTRLNPLEHDRLESEMIDRLDELPRYACRGDEEYAAWLHDALITLANPEETAP